MKKLSDKKEGSALVIALFTVLILSVAGSSIISHVVRAQKLTYQATNWQDSLQIAEGGVDMAMVEIRKSVSDPSTAWIGWASSTNSNATTPQTAALSKTSSILVQSGIGGNRSWAVVNVDAPSFLKDSSGDQWYRIRATGYTEISTRAEAVGNSVDAKLRKLDLIKDHRTGEFLSHPRVARVVEAIAKPVSMFSNALLSEGELNMNNENIVVDSYDSRDSTKSTNGQYDPQKRQEKGHIATNGDLIDAGRAQIRGSARTNGGTVLRSDNVTGDIVNNFFQELPAIEQPGDRTEPFSPSTVTNSQILTASSTSAEKPAGTTYTLSNIQLSGQNTLSIQGNSDGSPTYTQIVVTGNIFLSGQGEIVLGPGVHVRIFVQGNVSISGNGITNPGSALNFQLYGLRPAIAGSERTISISGNGGFNGAIYAPSHDLSMTGGGNGDSIFGSFVAKTIRMTGVQSVHYDEALADGGLISDYRIASWYEDTR